MDEYLGRYTNALNFGAEGIIFNSDFTPLVSKRISKETSISLPKNFESEDFWLNPEQNIKEILVSKHLSSHEEIRKYCILPLGYVVDAEKKQIDLIMPRATGIISYECEALQNDPGKHVKHLLEGFLILLNEGILRYDNDPVNIMYVKSEDTYKFVDFGSVCFFNEIFANFEPEKAIDLIRGSYSVLLSALTFSLCGGSALQGPENQHYLKCKDIVDTLSEERKKWDVESLDKENALPKLKMRVEELINLVLARFP